MNSLAGAPDALAGPAAGWRRDLADEAATYRLAEDVAKLVGPGDLVTLSGDLGAGKTTFARALIRILSGQAELEVPSPSFSLMQVYEGGPMPIVHADFYRIEHPAEIAEIGIEDAGEGALTLLEWPDRAGGLIAPDRLDIAFSFDPARGAGARVAVLTGFGAFAARIAKEEAVDVILHRSGWQDASRQYMQGDASTRVYERLVKPSGETAILMIAPKRPDGPPIRYGKSYSAIARLAEDIKPFVAVGQGLRQLGFSAPEILDFDLQAGLAILEDLGCEPIVDETGIIETRYAAALDALVALHGAMLPDTIPVAGEETYRIPNYDIDALSIEVELLLEWYAPLVAGIALGSGAKATFVNLWREVLQDVINARPTWTLRDFHSPNLIWLPDREGMARVGIIDFQDCVLGHPAYDAVSLLQDARVDVSDSVELGLLARYARLRREDDASFDLAAFARAYAILGAQRATKILGIFARLSERDAKPHYLAHLPRVEAYLAKNLAHPALSELRIWYETHLPQLIAPRM
jgi:tRNA threonylcarbamoyl adenosine modification protein YjeE